MRSLLRAIDANANRAREALRVMEDVARFGLDHAQLSGDLKQLRHDLAAALAHLPTNPVVVRDTPEDVGVHISTSTEGERQGARDIALAAGKRLTEALRSIEEHGKAVDTPRVALLIEQLRYRAYDVEQRLAFALGSARRQQWGVCVIITERLCVRPWMDVVDGALEGGADCIQLREKDIADRELVARAKALRTRTREYGAALIINDRPDIAMLCDADGVHLGRQDLPIGEARKLVGLERLVGVSATNIEQARDAARAGADYIGLGPMFPTMTKAQPGGRTDGSCAGPALLRDYLASDGSRPPYLAIGGISPANIGALVDAGCRGVAVCGSVCAADDPAAVVHELASAMRGQQTVTVGQE